MSICTNVIYSDFAEPTVSECATGAGEEFEWVVPYDTISERLFLALGLVTIVIIGGLMVFFEKNKTSKMMRSSRTFSLGILTGFLFLLIGFFMWPLQSSPALCYTKPWFLALGFGLVGGALLHKLFHLYHFFALSNNPERSISELRQYQGPEKEHERDQMLRFYFVGIVCLELTLNLIMMSVPSSRPDIKYECCATDEKIYTVCFFSAAFGWTAFLVNLVPVLLGAFFLIRVHHVHYRISKSVAAKKAAAASTSAISRFSDGPSAEEQIKTALDRQLNLFRPVEYVILLVVFCGIILTIIGYTGLPFNTSEGRLAYYCIRGIMFSFIVYMCLVLIFLPMYRAIKRETMNSNSAPGLSGQSSFEATKSSVAGKSTPAAAAASDAAVDGAAEPSDGGEPAAPASTTSYTQMTAV